MNTVRTVATGIWVLTFPTKEEVIASACEPLVPPLVEASKAGPLVLIANLPLDLRFVEPSMSTFWLEAMTKRGVQVKAIAVTTKSMAVRTVVSAFALAMKLSNKPLGARTFLTEEEAIAWARTVP